jgi:membrane protein
MMSWMLRWTTPFSSVDPADDRFFSLVDVGIWRRRQCVMDNPLDVRGKSRSAAVKLGMAIATRASQTLSNECEVFQASIGDRSAARLIDAKSGQDSAPESVMDRIRNAYELVRQTFADWTEDKVPRLGAALAFYTALSIAPLLVLSLRIAATFFGDDAARGEIERQMESIIGAQGAEAVQSMLENANRPDAGTAETVLSLLTLLFGASGVFGQLQDSLNTIWEVQPKPGGGILGFLRSRFLSFAMVMGVAFLLLVSLIVSATLSFVGTYASALLGPLQFASQAINQVISLAVFAGIFAMMFKFLPDAKIAWRDVWMGAAITAVLFTVGKFAIGLYLGRSSMASSYGVAGSLVVLLVWVYYSAQIVFFGAEFTQVYANRYGKRIVPKENAEAVTQDSRAQQGLAARPEKISLHKS